MAKPIFSHGNFSIELDDDELVLLFNEEYSFSIAELKVFLRFLLDYRDGALLD